MKDIRAPKTMDQLRLRAGGLRLHFIARLCTATLKFTLDLPRNGWCWPSGSADRRSGKDGPAWAGRRSGSQTRT